MHFFNIVIDFTQLKLKIKTIYAKLLRNSLGVITFQLLFVPHTRSPRRRRRRWTLLLRDEDHWQQNARARFFRCVSASASSRLSPSCLLLLVHVFVSISAFARPYISLSVSLLDARFLDAFVFNVAQQLSGPWRSTKRNSPQNASVRRQRRRQRQQQQQRRVTSVRGTEGGQGQG